jgi:PAS domain S-box-containing protein
MKSEQSCCDILSSIEEYAIFTLDEQGRIAAWTPAAEHVFGYTAAEAEGMEISQLYSPEDRAGGIPQQLLRQALAEGRVQVERWHVCKDGTRIWASGVATVRRDAEGKVCVTKVLRDLTRHKLDPHFAIQEEQRRHLFATNEQFQSVAEVVPQIVWTSRADGWVEYMNPEWFEFTGATVEQTLGWAWLNFVHPKDRRRCEELAAQSVQTGQIFDIEYRIRGRNGMYRWFLGRAAALRDKSGNIVKWYGTCTDIDHRKRNEIRHRLLADANAALSSSLDYETTLKNVAGLVVPAFADGCIVYELTEARKLKFVAQVFAIPERGYYAEQMRPYCLGAKDVQHGPAYVAETGKSDLVPLVNDVVLQHLAQDERHFEILKGVQFRSYIAVPLRTHDRTLGVISFISHEEGRYYDRDDLGFAEELGRRAALAIDNARLYRDMRWELEQRKRAEEELAAADRRKDEFLATLAHELRNPLAPIRHAMHVFHLYGTNDPTLQRAREIVERQVANMVRLVDDLLDVSRIQRGKITLRKERLNLQAILEEAIESTNPMILKQGHELNVAVPREPLLLDGDPTRLEQIFVNLLSNAAKYTPPGGKIWISAKAEGKDLAVSIRDSGIGIAPEMLPNVFNMFIQADKSLERSFGGLGIGLTIVRHLVEMHGGSIEARSEGLGKGSDFIVRLPAAAPAPSGTLSGGMHGIDLSSAAKSVLLVEDNEDSRETLSAVLSIWGHRVTLARDGAEAIRQGLAIRPDIAIVDVGLPGVSGYEVARQLRQTLGQGILLIALTGYGQPEDRKKAFDSGFNAHMVKPADLDELQRLINHTELAEQK